MRVAKGAINIPVPRGPKEKQFQYTARIQRMQAKYPVICFIPEDQRAFEIGQAALEMFEATPDSTCDLKILPINVETIQVIERVQQVAKETGLNTVARDGLLQPDQRSLFHVAASPSPAALVNNFKVSD